MAAKSASPETMTLKGIILVSGTILLLMLAFAGLETNLMGIGDETAHESFGTRDADCASCHYSINQTLQSGKHAGRPCTTCHDPGVVSELVLIVECTNCHGNRHGYNSTNDCINCHDAHATGFRHDVSNELCADCHANESVELHMGPHSWQTCTNCHHNHTIESGGCDTCHGNKHSDWVPGGYSYPDCIECHEPMNASFKHNISNDLCKDCHSDAFVKLQTGGHMGSNCTDCHSQHQVVRTTCDSCHPNEHGYTYPKCLECHEPMQATPGSPEFVLSQEIVAFAIVAVVAGLVLTISAIIYIRRKGKEE